MHVYFSFNDLPNKRGYGVKILRDYTRVKNELLTIDWEKESFLGTNSSLNLRTSIIENALISRGIFDENIEKGLFDKY